MDFAAIFELIRLCYVSLPGTGYTLHRFFLGKGIVCRGKFRSRLKFFCGGQTPVSKKSSTPVGFWLFQLAVKKAFNFALACTGVFVKGSG